MARPEASILKILTIWWHRELSQMPKSRDLGNFSVHGQMNKTGHFTPCARAQGKNFIVTPKIHYIISLLSPSFPPSHLFVQGIVVKVLHKKQSDHFYQRTEGIVEEVRDTFTGVVKMIKTGDKIKD